MTKHPAIIEFSKALYIKLGPGGIWEKECIDKGILRFGYKQTPFDAAISGDWETVRLAWLAIRGDAGTAKRDEIQIRHFFEAGADTLWITFYGGLLYWCFAKPGVRMHADEEGSYRETIDGWRNANIKGTMLSFEKLSGNLLKMQSFRGTICDVKEFDYLKRKISGQFLPQVDEAFKTENQMLEKIVPLMRLLPWQDFELLVDLIFSNSGWRRVSPVGEMQKTVDIELLLPTTGERAFVQIKSHAGKNDLADYRNRLRNDAVHHRMFFVWHSGDVGDLGEVDGKKIDLIGPKRLAQMVFDAGLTTWLREKVS